MSDPTITSPTRRVRFLVRQVPTLLAAAGLVGLLALGQGTGWKLPKFSELSGGGETAENDWCAAHGVPEAACVECHPELMPKGEPDGWCRTHGVHACPLCNPDVAQLPGRPQGTDADRQRAELALGYAPRPDNGHSCRQHLRRIQFVSDDIVRRLGIETAPARLGEVTETVTATGELALDPTRVAHLSPRVPGTVRAILKQVGDRVRAGEVVAVVEAADVGQAKGELLTALSTLALREQTLARLKAAAGQTVTEQAVLDAAAARAEAEVRVLAARQALTNLGLPVETQELRDLAPEEAAGRLRGLGLPEGLGTAAAGSTGSNNLLPVRSPFDGEVIERPAAEGEPAGPTRLLMTVADAREMWLVLHARLEDANRIRPGQTVRFRHDGHDVGDVGTVAWVSPAADPKTRTVPVRVRWPNANGRHHARTFGTAQVVVRRVPDAVVVPRSAVHWEGCCHVVFVRDRDYEAAPHKVFHVRKVRPGATDVGPGGPAMEIAAGLLPGEVVATEHSGILRSELLKNDLGEG